MTDTIVHNAKIATNAAPSFVAVLAIADGTISACGGDDEILRLRTPSTRVIDARGRTVIPGRLSAGAPAICHAAVRGRLELPARRLVQGGSVGRLQVRSGHSRR